MVTVRPETPRDIAAIREINLAAFPTPAEADLVDALRHNGRLTVSLVALINERPVGHIAFSPVTLDEKTKPSGLGLAPVAVMPEHQGQGIGSGLVTAGLARCEQLGVAYCVVLGEPHYYGRFRFVTASRHGLANEYGVDDPFMVRLLSENASPLPRGTVRYAPEFRALG